MITATVKRWGNSLGLLIPKKEAQHLHLQESQQVVVDLISIEQPLKELFGFCKDHKITRGEFLETRQLLEGKKI